MSSRSINSNTRSYTTSENLPYPIEELGYGSRPALTPNSSDLGLKKHAASPLSKQLSDDRHAVTMMANTNPSSKQPLPTQEEYTIDKHLFDYFQYRYEETINDTKIAKKFTPYIQFQWSLVLIQYSFHMGFVQHYNINCNKLPRSLNKQEMNKNSNIILEHGIKVLSKLCELHYGPGLYFMGCLYSNQLDLEFLQQFYENDPVCKQIFGGDIEQYKKLLNMVQIPKILPLNDSKALEYYLEASERTQDLLSITFSLYRSGVCLELGKGCPDHPDLSHAMQLYEIGWREYRDKLCGYKYGMNILKKEDPENEEGLNDKGKVSDAVRALNDVDTQQSLFELAKHYEKNDPKKSLVYYFRSAEKGYPLAVWKMGQIYEHGLLGNRVDPDKSVSWYMRDLNFSLNLFSISGWLLTGGGSFQPNESESFHYLQKASTTVIGTNNAKIQYGMARYYQYGIGCHADESKKLFHMKRAAKLGHSKAILFMNQLL